MCENNLMNKSCSCNGIMTIHMHTLIYSTKVKITGVPVYTCCECSRYEPVPCIKRDLGKLINELAETSERRSFSFTERNEWANVLKETFAGFATGDVSDLEESVLSAIQERIDLLLDIYQLANDCSDEDWMKEIARRLSQLSQQTPERAK